MAALRNSDSKSEFAQFNIRLPRDVGTRLIALLSTIAEQNGFDAPEKVAGSWQNAGDPCEKLLLLAESLSPETWGRI